MLGSGRGERREPPIFPTESDTQDLAPGFSLPFPPPLPAGEGQGEGERPTFPKPVRLRKPPLVFHSLDTHSHDQRTELRVPTRALICHIEPMTARMLEHELKTLSEAERAQIIRGALPELSPATLKALERQVHRLAHPEVPEDVWTGFEEAEDGRGIEIHDIYV